MTGLQEEEGSDDPLCIWDTQISRLNKGGYANSRAIMQYATTSSKWEMLRGAETLNLQVAQWIRACYNLSITSITKRRL